MTLFVLWMFIMELKYLLLDNLLNYIILLLYIYMNIFVNIK